MYGTTCCVKTLHLYCAIYIYIYIYIYILYTYIHTYIHKYSIIIDIMYCLKTCRPGHQHNGSMAPHV